MFDVIFISYNEINADENFNHLLSIVPYAKRINGIKGIHEAHKAAACLAMTNMVYIVDADSWIVPEFTFDYYPTKDEQDSVVVWKSKNAVNDLEYGYGGVKLFPTNLLKNSKDWNIDFTTSIAKAFFLKNQLSNITKFNTDPYNAWRSGFRECAKLASQVIKNQNDKETKERLDIWCTKGKERPFGIYCIEGAIEGKKYGLNHKDELDKINDFEWLQNRFLKI